MLPLSIIDNQICLTDSNRQVILDLELSRTVLGPCADASIWYHEKNQFCFHLSFQSAHWQIGPSKRFDVSLFYMTIT